MLENEPQWYKDAIIYETHVRAFQDSVNDGIGDFRGLTQRLDYLRDLGVTATWLLPFYPSPLRDDGYDIADYTSIHPDYGNLRDFQEFLNAAHDRELRVITELVVNHTSDQHPWFQRARRAPPGSVERDFYVWSDTPTKYADARIIFKDYERSNWAWDAVANSYYWHRFYSHQPDLNFDNPAVWNSLLPVLEFWMAMGVDGMRLDAIPYLYEREGTNCENLPETHEFLRFLRTKLDEKFPNRLLLAEANQWPEDAVAYFGSGDECHMAFHFPLMPRIFMSLHMEDRFPIIDTLDQTPEIPENCQWALFLRNHDELTLEMVTDEERDYMYRAYAYDPQARINLGIRRRLAPLLGNSRRRIELVNALLFSMPGTPVIYYGDEIGMGDNIYLGDRNGVRTPMQWSGDRNAGFSRSNPQRLYLPVIIDPEYHFEAVNALAQQTNPSSLLWWMKRIIALRKQHRAFGRGSLEFLKPHNPKILAFLRRFGDEVLLVVANLSRFVQYVELDLSAFKGHVPIELFGRTSFPTIREAPFPLSLGPHGFYWFSLSTTPTAQRLAGSPAIAAPEWQIEGDWHEAFEPESWPQLAKLLKLHTELRVHSLLGTRLVTEVRVDGVIPLAEGETPIFLALVTCELARAPVETHVLPIAFRPRDPSNIPEKDETIALLRRNGRILGRLTDARHSPEFANAILQAILQGKSVPLADETLIATAYADLSRFAPPHAPLSCLGCQGEHRNTSVVLGNELILKVFQTLEEGVNPELEVGRFLNRHGQFNTAPPLVGSVELRNARGAPQTVAVMHQFRPNEGSAWQFTLDTLSRFFEHALAESGNAPAAPTPARILAAEESPPPKVQEFLATFLEMVERIGRLTAGLHQAMSVDREEPAFAPEPFGRLYQRSAYQSMRTLCGQVLGRLADRRTALPIASQPVADDVLKAERRILSQFRGVLDPRLGGHRIRCHGNFHLGELLHVGNDFVVVDFAGDPMRPLSERRFKRSPLRDVASLILSLHAASQQLLHGGETPPHAAAGWVRGEDRAQLSQWVRLWYSWTSSWFVTQYYRQMEPTQLLPSTRERSQTLLDALLMERALHELERALHRDLSYAVWPLYAIRELLESNPTPA